MKSAILKMLQALTPILIQELIKAAALNVGGFQLWIAKILFKYGGKQVLKALKDLQFYVDREDAQDEAQKEFDKIKADPNTTPEQLGEAYEKYYNTRLPKGIANRNLSSADRL